MSDRETVDFLAGVPLLEGREEADLVELARVMRRRTLQEGELLWRQGDDARELVFVVDGVLSASLQLPGNRSVEIGSAGPREAVGEIALLDGRGNTMSVRATETATVLALGRMDFAALLAPLIAGVRTEAPPRVAPQLAPPQSAPAPCALARRRRRLPSAEDAARAFSELEYCGPPDTTYLRRMATSTTSIRWRSGAS